MVIPRIAIGLLHKSLEFGRLTDCLAKLPGNRVNNGPNMIETELDVIADPGEEGGSPLPAGSPLRLQRIRLILFDLDGTLVDSVGDLAWCGNRMLERLGLAVHDEQVARNWVGNGLERFVKRLLTGAMDAEPAADLYERGLEIFHELYAAHASDRSVVYPGALETLQRLSSKDLKLACVTNKPEPFTSRLIREMGLDAYFELVVAGNTTARKKPDPMPLHYAADHFGLAYDRCLMVGDSSNDVVAARAAGFAIACVPYGYNHGQDIRSSNPDLVVENLTLLADLFC
jgi:phosphoglycolate phosphatase